MKASWVGGAILSEPRYPMEPALYRYRLTRARMDRIATPPTQLTVIGLNPSTADALDDDATIRKLKGFCDRWGFYAFEIVNVFAYRTKSPKVLRAAQRAGYDIVGPSNDLHLQSAIARASRVLCAWGNAAIVDARERHRLAELLKAATGEVMALKVTNSGAPWHPLYVPYEQQPAPFTLE